MFLREKPFYKYVLNIFLENIRTECKIILHRINLEIQTFDSTEFLDKYKVPFWYYREKIKINYLTSVFL